MTSLFAKFTTIAFSLACSPLAGAELSETASGPFRHSPDKPREFFLFVAEGWPDKTSILKAAKEAICEEKLFRPIDRLHVYAAPDLELLGVVRVPEKVRPKARTRTRVVRSAFTPFVKFAEAEPTKTDFKAMQADFVRIAKAVSDGQQDTDSVCIISVFADPIFRSCDGNASWNWTDELVPSADTLDSENSSPFADNGVRFPPGTLVTWIPPRSRWSGTRHMASVEELLGGYFLRRGAYFLGVKPQLSSAFSASAPRRLKAPKLQEVGAYAMLATRSQSLREKPRQTPSRSVPVIPLGAEVTPSIDAKSETVPVLEPARASTTSAPGPIDKSLLDPFIPRYRNTTSSVVAKLLAQAESHPSCGLVSLTARRDADSRVPTDADLHIDLDGDGVSELCSYRPKTAAGELFSQDVRRVRWYPESDEQFNLDAEVIFVRDWPENARVFVDKFRGRGPLLCRVQWCIGGKRGEATVTIPSRGDGDAASERMSRGRSEHWVEVPLFGVGTADVANKANGGTTR